MSWFHPLMERYSVRVWLMKLPGVYVPQGDSAFLVESLRREGVPKGVRALDLCTGTGVVALAAAQLGAGRVHAVDVSLRATLAARCNARLHRLPVTVHRRDPLTLAPGPRFGVVTANPPYVPCPEGVEEGVRSARAWNAGGDGRAYLDVLCRRAPQLLTDDGVLWVVHSALAGPGRTLAMLAEAGLKAEIAARRSQPFGVVMHSRARWLEERGLIEPEQREEELVVIRAELVTGVV